MRLCSAVFSIGRKRLAWRSNTCFFTRCSTCGIRWSIREPGGAFIRAPSRTPKSSSSTCAKPKRCSANCCKSALNHHRTGIRGGSSQRSLKQIHRLQQPARIDGAESQPIHHELHLYHGQEAPKIHL